jgi:diketogulonate reductase-like aldo/keto reductase
MGTRRHFLGELATLAALGASSPARLLAADKPALRVIPASGEAIPAIGLGSWITFDVLDIGDRRANCRAVISAFFERGGRMIDSSPMYGQAQEVIGEALAALDNDAGLFSATKVWTPGAAVGQLQMRNALNLWGLNRFDLLHVHNLVDWQDHLPWMQAWQAEGRIRYTGVTTSHGRRHGEMLSLIETQPFDFVQFTYNIADREAEQRLLPAASGHGMAVVFNRPFQGGSLFGRVRDRPLPPSAAELGCENWAQYFLKFVISHPAVSCAIPATSRVAHLHENMGAMAGPMPDAALRARMMEAFEAVAR